jgi:DNA-binding NtrC family response regulator
MAWLLVEVFADEGIEVIRCASLDEINIALREHPHAIVVSDPWSRSSTRPDLSDDERDTIADLAARARLILTTTRQWALQSEDLSLGDSVTVIPKPFDLDILLRAVRRPTARLEQSA